jgi:hypothetical protein
MEELVHLADLIRIRNFVNSSVSRFIQAPAETGRIAEFVAAEIFDIDLAKTFVNVAIDGWFRRSSDLQCKSVNVKYRSSLSLRLNLINSRDLGDHPDFYLAFRGPVIPKAPSNEKMLPFVIESVYLFSAEELINGLMAEGYAKFGLTVKKKYWDAAMIYPEQVNLTLILTPEQRTALALFAPAS